MSAKHHQAPSGAPIRPLMALWRATEAVAAVEFAMVLPVMIGLLLGLTEVTLGISNDRKLTLVSRSLADLTSRATSTLAASDLSNSFSAARIVMQPYDSSKIKMTLSSMKVTLSSTTHLYTASVDWTCASGTGSATKPTNVTYPVPSGFQTDGIHYILAETVLPYKPMFGYAITGTLNLAENTPWPVRNVAKVTLPSSCLSGCTCPDPT